MEAARDDLARLPLGSFGVRVRREVFVAARGVGAAHGVDAANALRVVVIPVESGIRGRLVAPRGGCLLAHGRENRPEGFGTAGRTAGRREETTPVAARLLALLRKAEDARSRRSRRSRRLGIWQDGISRRLNPKIALV